MSWERLKNALQAMPATAKNGFEGLVTRLLNLFLDDTFILARAGQQPSGDARNHHGTTSIQAKRYKGKTRLNGKSIEGDIREALRVLPDLDHYVLAVTRPIAQLQDKLDMIQEETGLDIIVLDYADELSALGALCIRYWDSISDFENLSDLGGEFHDWVDEQSKSEALVKRLDSLKRKLAASLKSYVWTQQKAHSALLHRFGFSESQPNRFSYTIALPEAIERTAESAIREWWNSPDPVAYLQGEEGTGKSWVAAQGAKRISEKEGILVFWLDSIEWCSCTTLELALSTAFRSIGVMNEDKRRRLVRKTLNIWRKSILLVLDGVNQHGAIDAAKNLLSDCFAHDLSYLRILLTTRLLRLRPEYEASLWRDCHEIQVEPFNDTEFTAAIKQIGCEIIPESIPEELKHLAIVPRYFKICIKLRRLLGSMDNITKEVLLWADLLERIKGTDPQIMKGLDWQSEEDAEEILSKLAKEAEYDDARKTGSASYDLLNECFEGRYSKIRQDLLELRIAERAGKLKAEISASHIILGWALFLQKMVANFQGASVNDLVDRIRECLEPIPSEDQRTEALFAVLQLTVLNPKRLGESLFLKRAALLNTWVFSPNACVTSHRLEFWADADTSAYAEFVETLFEDLYAGDAWGTVVDPLAVIWRNNKNGSDILAKYLERWLLLTRTDEAPSAESAFIYQGHRLFLARNDQQLRLSSVAISVLSQRPDKGFIEKLALCLATLSLSRRKEKERNYPLKSVQRNVGILMRWRYTENVVPLLQSLAAMYSTDRIMLDGLRRLARSLLIFELPDNLKLPPREPAIGFRIVPTVQLIREKKRLFSKDPNGFRPSGNEMVNLAVRNDLPDLLSEDIDFIKSTVENICKDFTPYTGAGRRAEDYKLERYWPWLAKYFPEYLAELVSILRVKALDYESPAYLLHFLNGAFHRENSELNSDLFSKIFAHSRSILKGSAEAMTRSLYLTEIMLSVADERMLIEWLNFIAPHEILRKSVTIYPIPFLIPLLLPCNAVMNAKEKAKALQDPSPPRENAEEEFSEFAFWCFVAACATGQDLEIHNWTKGQIKRKDLSRDEKYNLYALMAASGLESWFEAILNDTQLWQYIDSLAIRAFQHFNRQIPDVMQIKGSFEELMASFPHDFVAYLLRKSNRENDFLRWGYELLQLACELIGKPPIDPQCRGKTLFQLDQDGKVEIVGHVPPPQQTLFGSALVSSWGVDHGGMKEFGRRLLGDYSEEEKDFAAWKQDLSQLRSWGHYDIFQFQAHKELRLWANENRDAFLKLAETYLEGIQEKPTPCLYLGGFTDAILCILLKFRPNRAYDIFGTLGKDTSKVVVRTYYIAPSFVGMLWNLDMCNTKEHDELRRRIFEDAKDDMEILLIASAALAEGAGDKLWAIVSGAFVGHELAKERALAVSILPWFADDRAIEVLGQLIANDPSNWVRYHARWGLEVAHQERSCRDLWREALSETEPIRISALLQRMKPALTPTARWWRYKIAEEASTGPHDNRIKAMFSSFWHHWSSVDYSGTKVYERKLKDFCRGEKIEHFIMPRMAPWWQLA